MNRVIKVCDICGQPLEISKIGSNSKQHIYKNYGPLELYGQSTLWKDICKQCSSDISYMIGQYSNALKHGIAHKGCKVIFQDDEFNTDTVQRLKNLVDADDTIAKVDEKIDSIDDHTCF